MLYMLWGRYQGGWFKGIKGGIFTYTTRIEEAALLTCDEVSDKISACGENMIPMMIQSPDMDRLAERNKILHEEIGNVKQLLSEATNGSMEL